MRRKRWTRAVGAFLASWFTLVASEHAPLNPCPMHGEMALVASSQPAADHANAHSHADPAPAQSGHDHTDGKCSCTGDCTSPQSSPAILSHEQELAATIAYCRETVAPSTADLPTATPFLRPFANGPPHLRITLSQELKSQPG